MTRGHVGFIGLGGMGEPMAARILEGGFSVLSCAHRRRGAIEKLRLKGLEEVETAALVGERADVLITCVVDEGQTDAVLRGKSGALSTLKPGSVLVVMSTISPAYCQDLAREVQARNISVLDCPVSGARVRAEQGTLAIICGGQEDIAERCRPILETMGTIHYCGGIGMGQVAKLVNQGIMLGIIKLVQEGRALGRSYGLDPDTLMSVLGNSTANTTVGENWNMFVSMWPQVVGLGQKDLDLCLKAAQAKDVSMPLIEARRAMSWELRPGD